MFDAVPPLPTDILRQAARLADEGQGHAAVELAEQVLALGQRSGDELLQAQAMQCLSSCELRLLGGYRRACELAQRAAMLYERHDDVAGEALALADHAIAATRLGQYEDAVESALLAVRLTQPLGPCKHQVIAQHALGVATYSGRNYAAAEEAYQQAVTIALLCQPPLSTYELHINTALVAVADFAADRQQVGSSQALGRLQQQLTQAKLTRESTRDSMAPGSLHALQIKSEMAHCLLQCWLGEHEAAARGLHHLRLLAAELAQPWANAATHWCAAELSLAQGDWPAAEAAAERMTVTAEQARHEGLIQLGYALQSHLCEAQGKYREALAALRALSRHEQESRRQNLQSRAHVIDWQLQLRQNRRDVQHLERRSQQMEQLAMKDTLTGLPNRRHFEQHLRLLLLGEHAIAPCLALIDVDHFKQVNDGFSHGVGDAVLRTLAQLLREHLREQDLPARLAGDEFVLLLVDVGLAQAQQICGRLQASVQAHDWQAIAPGLRVSISLGLAQWQPGESLEQWLERSDAAMYSVKRARRPG
ncbi:GGDEF domain-containing protein [Paucibacter sp. APW11]|uniref:diguanylate cyclase n=1 Tax=Roseateles aquae TaxID=3077235 RepID=A0ABU3P6S8_9BURK|nr:GGDEF domain-containing protein [Paucibacter sp. APW11]MDT8998266.1 GGDEF domain-containing protein [Paucibacter sp. APW11]